MFDRLKTKAFGLLVLTFLALFQTSQVQSYPLDNVFIRITDSNGKAVSGGKVYVFTAGTTTPVTTYSCVAMSGCANAHPVVADSGGKIAAMYIPAGSYKIRYTNSAGTTLYEVDNYVITDVDAVNANNFPVLSKTADYTVTSADDGTVISADASGVPGSLITITAEAQDRGNGFPFCVVNNGSTGTITISPDAGETINGAASHSLTVQYQSVCLASRGASGWFIYSSHNPDSLTTNIVASPGGRLTITSATPVVVANTTAQTTLYYTPYIHDKVPLYNGTTWTRATFTELSQTLADGTKSPAAAAASTNYDIFVWTDSGTIRATRGPAWTNGTTRSAGTALVLVNGIYLNNATITNGPAAQRGTYLGTISTSSSGANGELNMMFNPVAAAGGTNNRLDVWNMYNRVEVSSLSRESTNSWSYDTATWRSFNNSASNRITYVFGLNEDAIEAVSTVNVTGSGSIAAHGIGLDSTSAFSGTTGSISTTGLQSIDARYRGYPGIGSHFAQMLEYASATTTWYGDNNAPLVTQSGIFLQARM